MTEDSHDVPSARAYPDPWIRPAFNFGLVLSNTFSGLFRNIILVLICAVLISALGAAVMCASQLATEMGADDIALDSLTNGFIGLLTSAYLIFLGCFFYAFCMDVSYRNLLGYSISLKQSLWRSLPNALPLMTLAVLFWIAISLGYIALIIPGLILSAGWALLGPAYMFGRATILESFGRSWELTKGYKWMVWLLNFVVGLIGQFGALILFFLIAIVLVIVQAPDYVSDPDADLTRSEEIGLIIGFLFIAYFLTGLYASMKAAIYAECLHLQSVWQRGRPVEEGRI